MLRTSETATDWEKKFLADLLKRNNPLSKKQLHIVDRTKYRYDTGKDGDWKPEENFINTGVEHSKEGNFVIDKDGRRYGPALSRIDVSFVARWFDSVITEINGGSGTIKPAANKEPVSITDDDDFDDQF